MNREMHHSPRCHSRLVTEGTGVRIPPDERYNGTTSLAPRIYEGGGPRSGRGSPPAAAAGTLSVTASPCQLPQRGSRGRFAPFLPPAFMRGEGHAVAGGVPPPQRESPLSHGCAVPALPEGKPRRLRSVPAPRIYEGGGPRSGRGSPPPQRESLLSHGCAVPAPPEGKPRGLRPVLAPHIYEGGGPRSGRGSPPPQRGKPPQSRLRRASSPRGEAEGASRRSCPPHL